MNTRRLRALLGILALSCTRCSPYDFTPQIAQLNSATTTITGAVASSHQALVDDQSANYSRTLIRTRSAVVLAPTCFSGIPHGSPYDPAQSDTMQQNDRPSTEAAAPTRVPCGVYRPGGDATTPAGDPYVIPQGSLQAIKVLSDYTSALAAVTNSADRTNYNASVGKLATAVNSMISAVPGVGAGAGSIVGASINLIGWFAGEALDEQRFESLKNAVNAVDTVPPQGSTKPIYAVATEVGAQIDAIATTRYNILRKEVEIEAPRVQQSPNEETYRARYTDAQAISATIEGLVVKNSGQAAANALMAAHDQLVKAVNSSKPNLTELISALSTLKDKATAVQTAVTAASTKTSATIKSSTAN